MTARSRSLLALLLALFATGGCDADAPGSPDWGAPTEFTETPTGLKYRVLRQSKGKVPDGSSTVRVHYRGWLDDGTEFENTYTAKRGPSEVRINQAMRGWNEGLQLVGEGGMIELEIPAELGYGVRGMKPRIPQNATLHYAMELKTVR